MKRLQRVLLLYATNPDGSACHGMESSGEHLLVWLLIHQVQVQAPCLVPAWGLGFLTVWEQGPR